MSYVGFTENVQGILLHIAGGIGSSTSTASSWKWKWWGDIREYRVGTVGKGLYYQGFDSAGSRRATGGSPAQQCGGGAGPERRGGCCLGPGR